MVAGATHTAGNVQFIGSVPAERAGPIGSAGVAIPIPSGEAAASAPKTTSPPSARAKRGAVRDA